MEAIAVRGGKGGRGELRWGVGHLLKRTRSSQPPIVPPASTWSIVRVAQAKGGVSRCIICTMCASVEEKKTQVAAHKAFHRYLGYRVGGEQCTVPRDVLAQYARPV